VAIAGFATGSATAEDCVECHGKRGLSMEGEGGRTVSLYVDGAALRGSAHGALLCADCHGVGYNQVPHPEGVEGPGCGACHEEESGAVAASVHGAAAGAKVGCSDCHGDHDVLSPRDPRSALSPVRIAETCGSCHGEAVVSKDGVPSYRASAHAKMVDGRPAALCTDCHGTHGILPSDRPQSTVSPDRVSLTCGGCHPEIRDEYLRSVHGSARQRGIDEAPTCTDCHGTHGILDTDNPSSAVYATNVPAACSKCHEEERITRKYGLATKRLETYENSFHGIANRYGEAVVANCASCHGVHDILPSSDPASSIAPGNLAATCGKCHVGAGANFAKGKVHVEATRESSTGMFYVRRFYTWLIGLLGALFIVHIALDVARYRRKRREREMKS
jgi:nitrate/TMAO reductase-like tetraheme cytochrome c subunit